jgi:hypothetical protein
MKTLKDVLDEAGVEETHWPVDYRLEPGEVIQDKTRDETTRIPIIRNDGKRYNGTAES